MLPVRPGTLVQMVQPAQQDQLDPPDHRVAHRGLLAQPVLLALLVLQELAQLAPQAYPEPLVPQVLLELAVLLVR